MKILGIIVEHIFKPTREIDMGDSIMYEYYIPLVFFTWRHTLQIIYEK